MAFVLIKEDGTGLTDSNSYADVADSEAYHASRLYSDAWTTAGDVDKAKALVMATRAIDNDMDFRGYLKSQTQALKWPRLQAVRDGIGDQFQAVGIGQVLGPWWADNVIPPILIAATCEMARLLLVGDRTADAGDKGIDSVGLGSGAIVVKFNAADRPRVLNDEVMRMLAELGSTSGGGFMRRTARA